MYEEEKRVGNEFEVDVSIACKSTRKIITSIEQTVNYAEVYGILQEEFAQRKFLLETVAMKVADKLKHQFPEIEFLLHALSPWRTWLLHRELKNASLKLGWGIRSGKEIEKWIPGVRFQSEWFIHTEHQTKMSPLQRFINFFPFISRQEKVIHLSKKLINAFFFERAFS